MTEFKSKWTKDRTILVRPGSGAGVVLEINDNNNIVLDHSDAIPFARAVLEAGGIDAEIVTDIPKVTKHNDQFGVYYFDDGEPLATDLSSVEEAAQEVGYAVAVMRYHRSQPNPEVEKLATVLDQALMDLPEPTPARLAKALLEAGVRAP